MVSYFTLSGKKLYIANLVHLDAIMNPTSQKQCQIYWEKIKGNFSLNKDRFLPLS